MRNETTLIVKSNSIEIDMNHMIVCKVVIHSGGFRIILVESQVSTKRLNMCVESITASFLARKKTKHEHIYIENVLLFYFENIENL